MATEVIKLLNTLRNIQDDPWVTKDDFAFGVLSNYYDWLLPLRQHVLPRWPDRSRIVGDTLEESGFLVFRNHLTGKVHIHTNKGDIIF